MQVSLRLPWNIYQTNGGQFRSPSALGKQKPGRHYGQSNRKGNSQ
jgi:hypothetical protein